LLKGVKFFREKSSDESKDRSSPGTTATAVLIRDNYELVIGHLGDSRFVVDLNLGTGGGG
jgi:serine/threonine protein phosphatase PrpC